MKRSCKACSSSFDVTDEHLAFYESMAPTFAGERYDIPPPTHCLDCREQRRLAQANQLHLYKLTCDFTGEQIISNHHPDGLYKVYRQEEWHSDKWDALQYGQEFDFSRPFFEQYKELLFVVPHPALLTAFQYDENAAYTNHSGKNKDCYLIFDSDENRNGYYSYSLNGSQSCMDCFRVRKSELCYECIDCLTCYNCRFLQDCVNCSDSAFVKNCIGCRHCLLCSNLRNKEYCIENKQVSKEEFERAVSALSSRLNIEKTRTYFDQWKLQFPQKHLHGVQNENVWGDYLTGCKNADYCFDSSDLWDCRYVFQAYNPLKNCVDIQECGDGERLYECAFVGPHTNTLLWTALSPGGNLSDVYYCTTCVQSTHLFGCVGLRRQHYCVFNKKYPKDQYETVVGSIIEHMQKTGEWGEFFPIPLSTHAYNETLAQDYFPLSQKEVEERGWRWLAEGEKKEKFTGPISPIPDTIDDMEETITEKIFTCAVSGDRYKISPQELALLKQMKLPPSDRCFFERHRARMARRNPRRIYHRTCMKCKKAIKTTYAPDRPEIVYCEVCFLREVY